MFKNHTKSENIKTFINYLIKSICYHSTVFEKFIYISGNYSTILIYRMKTNLFSKYGLVLLLGFFLIQSSVFGQTKTITGRVTDAADNTALPGVTVTVKGTTVATQTNVDGQYSIAVPSSNSVLVFTFVGMVTHEEAVGNRSQVDVGLKSDQAALDEVVVIGYGTVKRRT